MRLQKTIHDDGICLVAHDECCDHVQEEVLPDIAKHLLLALARLEVDPVEPYHREEYNGDPCLHLGYCPLVKFFICILEVLDASLDVF